MHFVITQAFTTALIMRHSPPDLPPSLLASREFDVVRVGALDVHVDGSVARSPT